MYEIMDDTDGGYTVHVCGMTAFVTEDDVYLKLRSGDRFIDFVTVDGRKVIVNTDAILWVEQGKMPDRTLQNVVDATLDRLFGGGNNSE